MRLCVAQDKNVGMSPMSAKKKAAKKKITTKRPGKKTVGRKMPPPRLPVLAEEALTPEQAALLNSIRSGPRGGSVGIRGPFAVLLHAPAFGELAQQLGGHCRFNTAVPPRLSEFAVLATAKLWRGRHARFAHGAHAGRAGG